MGRAAGAPEARPRAPAGHAGDPVPRRPPVGRGLQHLRARGPPVLARQLLFLLPGEPTGGWGCPRGLGALLRGWAPRSAPLPPQVYSLVVVLPKTPLKERISLPCERPGWGWAWWRGPAYVPGSVLGAGDTTVN